LHKHENTSLTLFRTHSNGSSARDWSEWLPRSCDREQAKEAGKLHLEIGFTIMMMQELEGVSRRTITTDVTTVVRIKDFSPASVPLARVFLGTTFFQPNLWFQHPLSAKKIIVEWAVMWRRF
jgi:hypothetical protein